MNSGPYGATRPTDSCCCVWKSSSIPWERQKGLASQKRKFAQRSLRAADGWGTQFWRFAIGRAQFTVEGYGQEGAMAETIYEDRTACLSRRHREVRCRLWYEVTLLREGLLRCFQIGIQEFE